MSNRQIKMECVARCCAHKENRAYDWFDEDVARKGIANWRPVEMSGWQEHTDSSGYLYYTYGGWKEMELPEEGPADLKPNAPGPQSAKPPMHALRLDKLQGLARVLEYGNLKYARDNWVGTAKNPDLYIGAALRHLAAIMRGEYNDPESGLPHVNHLQASCLILEEALKNSGTYMDPPYGA